MTGAIILASASSTRAEMLRAAGVAVVTDSADIDEATLRDEMLSDGAGAEDIALALADAKALAVSHRHPGALVLGADQVLVHDRELLSKAPSLGAARDQLARLRGSSHQLLAAAAMVRDGAVVWHHVEGATLTMRSFSDAFLDDYLDRIGDLALTSVGCYHLEGLGAQLFARVDGDYFTVLGLPLLAVLDCLRTQGVLRE